MPKIWLVCDHVEHHSRGEFIVSVATALLSLENVDRVPCSLHPAGAISNYEVAIESTLIVLFLFLFLLSWSEKEPHPVTFLHEDNSSKADIHVPKVD